MIIIILVYKKNESGFYKFIINFLDVIKIKGYLI